MTLKGNWTTKCFIYLATCVQTAKSAISAVDSKVHNMT